MLWSVHKKHIRRYSEPGASIPVTHTYLISILILSPIYVYVFEDIPCICSLVKFFVYNVKIQNNNVLISLSNILKLHVKFDWKIAKVCQAYVIFFYCNNWFIKLDTNVVKLLS
jgi:hypothetical protein